ncbi:MAG: sel1 repeat family protein, partial [Lentisphaeria bacterium]|nr:sel1 repeat family protein [Lentisphaeria bacterium]
MTFFEKLHRLLAPELRDAQAYQKAAERGNARAQYNLGQCYEQGKGVPVDQAEAVKWYQKAAEQGNASAQYKMGYCYEQGKGLPIDQAEAVKWYQEAAKQKN